LLIDTHDGWSPPQSKHFELSEAAPIISYMAYFVSPSGCIISEGLLEDRAELLWICEI
jgi:hypothetical protein